MQAFLFAKPPGALPGGEGTSELATSPTPSVALVPEPCRSGVSGSSGHTFRLWSGPRMEGPETKTTLRWPCLCPSRLVSRALAGAWRAVGICQSHSVRHGGGKSRPGVGPAARVSFRVAGVRSGETRTTSGSGPRAGDLNRRRRGSSDIAATPAVWLGPSEWDYA